ncbi:hypothetical protein JOF29_000640 [Kribbella aluminosa]|uniref:Uncharacterized protein n=1 Tax=Kribbella aluminosa TaxID=416017 RepID=A0ABS4UD43_9ACTN|nr:hypothetical protein [Kribbella aluminosa]MBP2349557.1 hypothetical protein [Kribbella aluminosa]
MCVVLRACAAIGSSRGWAGYPEELEQPDLPTAGRLGELGAPVGRLVLVQGGAEFERVRE